MLSRCSAGVASSKCSKRAFGRIPLAFKRIYAHPDAFRSMHAFNAHSNAFKRIQTHLMHHVRLARGTRAGQHAFIAHSDAFARMAYEMH